MKKILVVFYGVDYPEHIPDLAMKIAEEYRAVLHPVFIKPVHVRETLVYPFPNDPSLPGPALGSEKDLKREIKTIEANREHFTQACTAQGIPFTLDEKTEVSLSELIDYSAFSDLVIADCREALEDYFFKDFLAHAQCPVLLFNRSAILPERIILTYDENPSSVYAMKQFSYLFPVWRNKETVLVTINPKEETGIEKGQHPREWLNLHFPKLDTLFMKGNPNEELVEFVERAPQGTLVVMGAFGRKGLSALFHSSLSQVLLDQTRASLFIAHY